MAGSFFYGANVEANGIRQHYLRYGGSGPKILLVPGITSPAVTWGFVGEDLGADHDVYILDVRGRGLSSAGPDLPYSLDDCAADLNAFVEALDLQDVIGLGHSMGARHLLRAEGSGKFAKLILVDPPMSGPGRRPYPTPLDWYVDSLALARRGVGADELRPFTPSWTDEQLRLRAEWLHSCEEEAVIASFKGFHEDDIFPDIAALRTDAVLIAAERGGVVSAEDRAEVASLRPEMLIVEVAGAGHMIPWDNFAGFVAEVRSAIG